MIKVKALDTYEKNNISDKDLGRIPKAGEEFEVSAERLEVLKGNNEYKKAFVKEVKETKDNKRDAKDM